MSLTTQAVYSGGVLKPLQPLALAEGETVEVTIATQTAPMSSEEWKKWILSTAGKWQGDFDRPDQRELEEREPLQ